MWLGEQYAHKYNENVLVYIPGLQNPPVEPHQAGSAKLKWSMFREDGCGLTWLAVIVTEWEAAGTVPVSRVETGIQTVYQANWEGAKILVLISWCLG